MKKILTVAGSDSSGGAGIQADLKTITLLGEYGLSVVTALTAQNTQGVIGIHPVPPEFISSQWDAVVSDISVDAVKTGMLWDEKVIRLISQKIKKSSIPVKVFDPVMVSKSGACLLTREGQEAFIKEMLPLATIVTPNIPEAKILSRRAIRTLRDMEKAAETIHRMGAKLVVIKGGHLRGQAVDVFFDGKEVHHFSSSRIKTIHTHGTGCTFASAVAVELTRNQDARVAVQKAKDFITASIKNFIPLGKGRGPVNPCAPFMREAEIYRAIQAVEQAIKKLESYPIGSLIPEVQSNLGYALSSAKSADDVIAFPGRIIRVQDNARAIFAPAPGGSKHIANIVLTAMHFNADYRAAMNIRYSREILQKCRKQHWDIKKFDRRKEPERIKLTEGSSLEWGVGSVLEKCASIPDIIYDLGDVGKEPMIRIFGKNPEEVVNKVLCLL